MSFQGLLPRSLGLPTSLLVRHIDLQKDYKYLVYLQEVLQMTSY